MSKIYNGQGRLADKNPPQLIKKKNVNNWGGPVIPSIWHEKPNWVDIL